MLRKDMIPRISADARGKITTGMLVEKNGKTYPKSLDYFNISAFKELIAIYGEKPKKLVVVFPSDDITDFFYTEYSLWGGKKDKAVKKRICDGETCRFKIPDKINGNDYFPGNVYDCLCKSFPESIPKDSPLRCKCYTSVKAFVVNWNTGKIENAIPYLFESRSRNTSDILYSQIANIKALTGGKLMGVPFILEVEMKEDFVDGEKRKYPIWKIQAFGTIDMVVQSSIAGILPTTDENALQINNPKQIDQNDGNQKQISDGQQNKPKLKSTEWLKKKIESLDSNTRSQFEIECKKLKNDGLTNDEIVAKMKNWEPEDLPF